MSSKMTASEVQPLLPTEQRLYCASVKSRDGGYATPEDIVDDPKSWSALRKWRTIAVLSLMAFNVYANISLTPNSLSGPPLIGAISSFSCIAVVPISDHILFGFEEGGHSKSAGVLLVTAWELGEAIGPLLLAPFSESTGRGPALHLANAVFLTAHVLAAICGNKVLLIMARTLAGLAVATTVLNPAIVGDLFVTTERGSAMAVLTVAPIIGAAVGPGISGYVTQLFGWRCVFWISVSLAAASEVLLLTCFNETHRVASSSASAVKKSLWESITKPIVILYSSRILVALCVSHGMAFAVYCIITVTLPDVFEHGYEQSMSAAGLSFMSYIAGSCMSIMFCHVALDRVYKRFGRASNTDRQPEFWLPLAIGGAFALPGCVVLYGWVTVFRCPMVTALLCLVLLGIALTLFSAPIFAYIIEAFGDCSASATAGVIMTRGMMGVIMPLAVGPLVKVVGYGWCFSMLGGACLMLSLFPLLLVMRKGEMWRQ